ncbi:MAG: FAD-containing oxidoreductase [Acidobacteriota bacterium]
MSTGDYDVIVIGGGTAGSRAARTAAARGARTAMINDGELGGLCILRGCMPTKAMLASAHAAYEARHLDRFGVRLEGRVVPDFPAIMERKRRLVRRFQQAKIRGIEAGGYEVIDARGRLTADGAVDLGGGRTLRAGRGVVLAVGSVPSMLPIPGIDDVPVWTSDDVMALEDAPPASLVVQGAGPIGLELAQFFARIGTEVLLVNRSPLLGRCGTAHIGEELRRALEAEENFELAVPAKIARVARDGSAIRFEIEQDGTTRTHRAEAFLMAVGRRPAIDDLGLEQAGVRVDGNAVVHDEHLQTTRPGVYVAGDATGHHEILHIANQEGEVAGHNAAAGRPERTIDYRLLMQVIFTDPPFAKVGQALDEARAAGRDAVEAVVDVGTTGRALTMGAEFGRWSLVAERGSGEILGSAILAPRADEIIHAIAAVMHWRGTVRDILALPWYHPTVSEVVMDLARRLS